LFTLSLVRRFRAVLLAAVALALAFGAVPAAFAQDEEPPAAPPKPGVRWGGGEVTALGDDSFDVHTRRGRDVTVIVEATTAFFNGQGLPASFADLTVGARVGGVVEVRDDGQTYARLVIIVPPKTRYVGVGVVTALEDDAFHFVSRRGQVWEFYVDDATAFSNRAGDPLTFADLRVEARAGVHAELRDDGKWWALEVKIGR
jgi:hypothetical protein